jgi:hypothetical protein
MFLQETYSKVRVGKCLYHAFPVQNVLKGERDTLSPLLSNFALENSIRVVQENREKLEMNETNQLLDYDDDIHLFAGNINTFNRSSVLY